MESGDLNVGTVETVKYETIEMTNNYASVMPSVSDRGVGNMLHIKGEDNTVHIQQIVLEPPNPNIKQPQVFSIQVPSSGVNTMNLPCTTASSANIQMLHTIQPSTVAAPSTPQPKMLFVKHILVDGQSIPALVDSHDAPVSLPVLSQQDQPTSYNGMTISPKRIDPLNQISHEEEQPLYVNAKQYQRILKRRQQRAKLEAMGRIPKTRQKYMYESRHQHALKRTRKSGGKFGKEPSTAQDNTTERPPENNITYCHPKMVPMEGEGGHMMEVNQIRVITSTDSPTSHSAIQSLVDAL